MSAVDKNVIVVRRVSCRFLDGPRVDDLSVVMIAKAAEHRRHDVNHRFAQSLVAGRFAFLAQITRHDEERRRRLKLGDPRDSGFQARGRVCQRSWIADFIFLRSGEPKRWIAHI